MSTPPDPDPPRSVPAFSVRFDEAEVEAIRREVAKSLSSVVADQAQLAAVARGLSWPSPVPSLKQLGEAFRVWDPERLRGYWVENAPDNWAQLENEWLDIFDVVESTGLCVAWAPDDAVIREMIAAADIGDCLVQNRDGVLADMETALERACGVPIAGHADACEFAAEAVASARDGRSMAAQALAACGFATVLNISHGIDFAKARTRFATDLGDTTIGTMRASVIEFCSHQALEQYKPGGPLPRAYARHATHHGARGNFSEANSLSSLLLLVAWLRELKWIEEHDPAALTSFAPI